ncbi:MAG TPA: hypothetical protein VJN68_11580, partial [Burkholderiaceae bacterium]|nr:hypothetical protein [Burkholderiaceae bacterium]
MPPVAPPAIAPGGSFVQSFARGLAVIRSFSAEAPSQTLSEVAARAGMTLEDVQQSRTRRAPPESIDPATLDSLEISALWQEPVSALEKLEREERVRLL